MVQLNEIIFFSKLFTFEQCRDLVSQIKQKDKSFQRLQVDNQTIYKMMMIRLIQW